MVHAKTVACRASLGPMGMLALRVNVIGITAGLIPRKIQRDGNAQNARPSTHPLSANATAKIGNTPPRRAEMNDFTKYMVIYVLGVLGGAFAIAAETPELEIAKVGAGFLYSIICGFLMIKWSNK